MTTRLQLSGPQPNITVTRTAARTTAQPARPFQQLLRAGSQVIVATAEQAANRLPGGPILAAALRGAPGARVAPGDPSAPEGASSAVSATSSALTRGGESTDPLGASTPEGSADLSGMLARNADNNAYFLKLQEDISQENRKFTTLSNVLKARHETVKNAISNIR